MKKNINQNTGKIITIKHIAKIAGVSFSTVAKALRDDPAVNIKTREKVQKIADEIDYYPNLLAKGLKNKKTKTIGIILNDLKNPFYSDIYKVIGDILNERDYTMLLCDSNYNQRLEKKNIITMLSKGVEGIIISPVNENSENINLILKSNLKTVFIDSLPEYPNINYVYVNHEKAAFLAAEHLIKNGHKEILLLNGPSELSSSQHFLRGYFQALAQYQIQSLDELVTFNEISIESGYHTMKEMYKKKIAQKIRYSAIMTLSDLLAIGVYEAAKEMHLKIPDEVSIIGYDNIFATKYINPPLTTVHQPKNRTGINSINILLKQISGESLSFQKMIIDPNLIKRESVKKIK
jgi:LacI family transcriptional regulator